MLPFDRFMPMLALRAALMSASAIALIPTAVQAEPTPQVAVSGGARRDAGSRELSLWLNSPAAALTIQNPTGRFYRTSVRWSNVPANAYLVSPQGVADAPGRTGCSLLDHVLVSAGGSSSWKLEPNLKGDYTFAVSSGALTGLEALRHPNSPSFAMHLGNAGKPLVEAMQRYEQLAFPTYVLPGSQDNRKEFEQRTGDIRREFAVERDRYLVVDDADGRLGPAQRAWVVQRLAAYRAQKARHVFVFMHRAPLDQHRGRRNGLTSRKEARALAKVLREGGVSAVFAGHMSASAKLAQQGVDTYGVGSGQAVLVRVQGDRLNYRFVP